MRKILIVNADDGNLTAGVTQAIMECHDQGILSSTTWMVNLPHSRQRVEMAKARPQLGVGIHLNITAGLPVAPSANVPSLLSETGKFRHVQLQRTRLPKAVEVRLEYESQIMQFRRCFGRMPTHIDTHHQIHDHPFYLTILSGIANRYGLPLRRSKLLQDPASYDFHFVTSDYLWGDLDPSGYWRRTKLENLLKSLPPGVNEIMTHPGINDHELQSVSSFTTGREQELILFSDPNLRKTLDSLDIRLSHYGVCYT